MNNKLERNLMLVGGFVSLIIIIGLVFGDLLIETEFTGTDATVDQTTLSDYQYSRVMTKDADSVSYSDKRTESNGNYDIATDVSIEGGSGTRSDRYEFRAKSELGSQELRVTEITDFSGEAVGYIHVNDDGTISYDSKFSVDGVAGNWYARAVDARSGRPVTIDTFRAIGNITLAKHFNITEDIKTPEDWLAFCNTFSDELTESVGAKLEPDLQNYTINQTLYEMALKKFLNMSE